MHASVWFEFFDGLCQFQNPRYMKNKHDINKTWDLNWETSIP